MDVQMRLDGLTRFLTLAYGERTDLPGLLDTLGFEDDQARLLREDCLPDVAEHFVEALHRRLTSGDKDLWFHLLSRRYGLDGEPPMPLEEAATALQVDAGYAAQAQGDALQKCKTKSMQQDLIKDLRRIALDELSKSSARPQKNEIAAKLKRLADLHAAVDMTRLDYESKRNQVLKKVQAELDALEAEYQPLLDSAEFNAEELEKQIKNDVLLAGESVATDIYHAVYVKGRVTWDSEGISHYARAHPEVLQYRKQGDPSVSIRKGR